MEVDIILEVILQIKLLVFFNYSLPHAIMKDHFYVLGGEKSEAIVIQFGRNLGVAPMKHASKQKSIVAYGKCIRIDSIRHPYGAS